MKIKHLILPLLAGILISTSAYAQFEGLSMMRMGDWDVDFSGNVNGFATWTDCDNENNSNVAGGLACGSAGEDDDISNIRTGLLPSWFNFYAGTVTEGGIETAVHLSFQPGIDSDSDFGGPLDGALGLNSSNFRQVFLTWGNDSMGTFKIGRDLGVFAGDAILNDMTLLGVGSGAGNGGGNTTLGRIGVGYIYADWKSQIQYTSPNWNGFSFTAALVDPWGTASLANPGDPADGDPPVDTHTRNYSATSGNGQEGDTFGFEGKINYAFQGDAISGNLWASFIYQEIDFNADLPGLNGVNGINFAGDDNAEAGGYDVGGKIAMGGFDLVGYYYDGEGIGTTGFLLDALDAVGDERDSDGYYVQARYRLPTVGTLLGVSYGESTLEETDLDKARLADAIANNGNYALLDTNESWVFGIYHPIGEALNLVAEYTQTESEAHNGGEAEDDTFALGAIMFF